MVAIVTARGIGKSFADPAGSGFIRVLHDIDVNVEAGEMVTIVGPSGSGKSTLLQCLSGLDVPSTGSVRIAGTDLSSLGPEAFAQFRREHLGFVFQSYNLIPALSAADNVALPLRLSRGAAGGSAVSAALASVGLSEVGARRPGQLSGGQQQRVAIARALAVRPSVLFADEPTGALDTEAGARVLRLLRDYACGDRSIVMVTHDLEAAALGDRVLVLRDGGVHSELTKPTPAAVLAAVEHARQERA